MTVGERIQRTREELGITQTELAHLMGYASKSAISRAETSGDEIGINRVSKFAKALRTTPAYLMGWEDEENTSHATKQAFEDAELLKKYHSLSDTDRQVVKSMIDSLYEKGKA